MDVLLSTRHLDLSQKAEKHLDRAQSTYTTIFRPVTSYEMPSFYWFPVLHSYVNTKRDVSKLLITHTVHIYENLIILMSLHYISHYNKSIHISYELSLYIIHRKSSDTHIIFTAKVFHSRTFAKPIYINNTLLSVYSQ